MRPINSVAILVFFLIAYYLLIRPEVLLASANLAERSVSATARCCCTAQGLAIAGQMHMTTCIGKCSALRFRQVVFPLHDTSVPTVH
jgi:hypothetical protein